MATLLAFCQATRDLPTDIKKLIWEMSQETPFEQWMNAINTLLVDTHGVQVGDVPDQPFVDLYEEGLEPQDVVSIIINDMMFIF
jgi:hypothetical protein